MNEVNEFDRELIILLLSLCVQLLGAFLRKQVTVDNVLYPLAAAGVAWFIGVLYITPLSRVAGRSYKQSINKEKIGAKGGNK